MKKIIITGLLAVCASVGASAQGVIFFDNQANTNVAIINASSSGGVFKNGAPDAENFNLQLFGGSSSSNMVLLATLLSSDGSAITGAAAGAPGQWIDGIGNSYVVPGVAAGGTGFFDVQVWDGPYGSYAAALSGKTGFGGDSGVFQNGVGGGPIPTPDLTGLPSFSLVSLAPVPEPTTLALCGLGAASLLLFRRKK